jgi:hypothetical protein
VGLAVCRSGRGAADLTGRVGDAISFRFVNQAVFQATIIVDPRTGALAHKIRRALGPARAGLAAAAPAREHSTVVHLALGGVASLRQIP